MTNEEVNSEPTEIENTQEQSTDTTPEVDVDSSEAEQTPTEHQGGDLKIALQQERERRRTLEQQLSDPYAVYEQAKRLGIAVEEEQPQDEEQPQVDIGRVRLEIEAAEARRLYPDIVKDKELSLMADALIDRGYTPLQAAETVSKRFKQQQELAKAEGRKEAETLIEDKGKASTIKGAGAGTGEEQELAEINRRIDSGNKYEQQSALEEKLKRELR